jgi:multisubunit Na+/H+ antiporter MnhG subunit
LQLLKFRVLLSWLLKMPLKLLKPLLLLLKVLLLLPVLLQLLLLALMRRKLKPLRRTKARNSLNLKMLQFENLKIETC